MLVWNPYSRGRLGPAKSEDPKGGEGKADANLTNFLSTDAAGGTPTRRHALGRLPTPAPSARKSVTQTAQKTALCAPATWSPGESPAPAHRRNFQSMLFRSNRLLATEGRETPTTLRVWVTGGGSPREFVTDCLPLWPIVRKIDYMRDRVR